MPKTCHIHVKTMVRTCLKHVLTMPRTCDLHVLGMVFKSAARIRGCGVWIFLREETYGEHNIREM